MNFLEYGAAMWGCYSSMPPTKREELHRWEADHVDGSGKFGTHDWPGWEKYLGPWKPRNEPPRDRSGYVYVVRASSGECKIGSARCVETRVAQLQTANPNLLAVLVQFHRPDARCAERELQERYYPKRIRNEWFDLNAEDITKLRLEVEGRAHHDSPPEPMSTYGVLDWSKSGLVRG